MLQFNWYVDDHFKYLENEVPMAPQKKLDDKVVTIYINKTSPYDDKYNIVKNNLPCLKTGLDGNIHNCYVSYYLSGKVIIISNCNKNYTIAYINPQIIASNKRLFISKLMRNHINKHWLNNGFVVYHCSALYDIISREALMVLGSSGNGKTTFVLEAIKSGNYKFISEDKTVLNPKNNQIFGSSTVHICSNSLYQYEHLIKNISLINGGNNKKYRAKVNKKFYKASAKVHKCIILNQQQSCNKSFLRKLSNIDKTNELLQESQKELYFVNEKDKLDKACSYLLKYPIYELYRNQSDINFNVYKRNS